MLTRKTPLARSGPIKKANPSRKPERESKLSWLPKRSKRGPPRDAVFLAFVRSQGCMVPRCNGEAQAHHWGKHGHAIKCSDYETVPLCDFHHNRCWHDHKCLPEWAKEECLLRFAALSEVLVMRFRDLKSDEKECAETYCEPDPYYEESLWAPGEAME